MNFNDNFSQSNLTQQLIAIENQKSTGKLEVESTNQERWIIYFLRGRMIWVHGGCHAYRSWQRHLKKHGLLDQIHSEDIEESEQFECWNYYLLSILLNRDIASREQIKQLIFSQATEAFFDITQQEHKSNNKYVIYQKSADFLLASGLQVPITFVDFKECSRQAREGWSDWCRQGLQNWSPNLSPRVVDPQRLAQEVPTIVYENFIRVLDNQHSLRDLSVLMNQDLCKFTYSLSIYVHKGLLEFITIADLQNKNTPLSPIIAQSQKSKYTVKSQPLIACIDDSPQVRHMMKYILTKAGYNFLGIENAIEAIPQLITHHPDLIFLDIGMPIMNGYELCAKIQQTSKLKEIPVVILTSNDAFVDRVQAKTAGASGFLNKPIKTEEILKAVQTLSSSSLF
ncbi:response regulator receiver protein [Rippkaea orientalis PCC 8801]|uniref:Protein PatA n=1 Tax=Rippkaea orientalis (strain PCC 8801 / RF-1) TaxID=41431 RepID=B7K5D2_RIPO1|nr:response regulator [Rippkaea orientalis]ACK67958.1 response regulator receiver protein [Rippkaea orientalis PCC 8801]